MDIILLNGFLGCGKTTLLKRLLQFYRHQKSAIVMNEFGDVAMDDKEVEGQSERLVTIGHGSILCSCKSDEFTAVMLSLLQQDLDVILIETSGFANPDSLDRIFSFIQSRSQQLAQVHSITICDASTITKLLQVLPVVKLQLEVADVIVINKIDLLQQEKLSEIKQLLRSINDAPLLTCSFADVDLIELLRIPAKEHDRYAINIRNTDFSSLVICLPACVDYDELQHVLQDLSATVFRIKGFVSTTKGCYRIQVACGHTRILPDERRDQQLVCLYSTTYTGKTKILQAFQRLQGVLL